MSCIYVISTAVYVEFVSFPILALVFWANTFQRPSPALPVFPDFCKLLFFQFTHQKHLKPNLSTHSNHANKTTQKHHGLSVSPKAFNWFKLLGSGKVSKASAWGPTTIKTNTSSSPPRASKATFHTCQRHRHRLSAAGSELENTAHVWCEPSSWWISVGG